MTVITKISVGKKNKSRYNIFIDKGNGEEFGFSVGEDVLIKMDLKKGKELDELDMIEIAFQDDIQKAYSLSLLYLSHRMRSESEVVKYLKEKEYGDHVIKEAIHKLYGHGYLNDREFAEALVRTRINSGDKGPVIIARELKEKGIKENVAEQALALYKSELQLENAAKHIQKGAKQKAGSSLIEMKRKIEQTLIRKGFPGSIIEEAMRDAVIEKDEEAEWESLVLQGEKAHRRYSKYTGYEYAYKMKGALYRKGFPIELIDRFIEEKQTETGE